MSLSDIMIDRSLLEHVTNVHASNRTTVTMNQTTERKNKKNRDIYTHKTKFKKAERQMFNFYNFYRDIEE